MKISYFENISDKNPVTITVEDLVERIRNGSYACFIDKVRKSKSDQERGQAKKNLPAITVSGIFEGGHRKDHFVSHSGLIQVDFDKVSDVAELKSKLITDPHTLVAFVSPSGTGVKAIVRIPANDNKAAVKYLSNYYQKKYGSAIDGQCCDVSRLCFVSHDPDTFFNKNAAIFVFHETVNTPSKVNDKVFEAKDSLTLFGKAGRLAEKNDTYTDGNRNTFVFKLACHCNRYGVSREAAERLIADHFDLPAREIRITVKSAYSDVSGHGKYRDDVNRKQAGQLVKTERSQEGEYQQTHRFCPIAPVVEKALTSRKASGRVTGSEHHGTRERAY